MALPTRCYYPGGKRDVGALAAECEAFSRDIFDRVLLNIDGANLADSLLDDDCGLIWKQRRGLPKQICAPALGSGPGTVRRKGSSATNPSGIELHVKASDAIYGRVCVVDSGTPTVQRISLIPEDPAAVTNPGGTISTPTGTMIFEGRAGDEFVFNESSIDTDFRVESNGNANAINVDAGNDRVGILKAPGVAFDVAGKIRTDNQVESTIATGTAPLVVASTTVVTNLNADLLDGVEGSAYATDAEVAAGYQPLDTELTALAGLTSAADKVPYFTGSGAAAVADFTAAGRALVDDANAAAQRTTLDVPGLSTANTYSEGAKQTMRPSETTAGLNIGQGGGDPSGLANGDVWGTTGDVLPKYRKNGATVKIGCIRSGVVGSAPTLIADEFYNSTDTNELLVGV